MAETSDPKPSSDADSAGQAAQEMEPTAMSNHSSGNPKDVESAAGPAASAESTWPHVHKMATQSAPGVPRSVSEPTRLVPERSVSSTKATTIPAPTQIERSQSAHARIPASDSASLGSVPSGLDTSSVGAPSADQKGSVKQTTQYPQLPNVSSLTPPPSASMQPQPEPQQPQQPQQPETSPLPPPVQPQSQPQQLQPEYFPPPVQPQPQPQQPQQPQQPEQPQQEDQYSSQGQSNGPQHLEQGQMVQHTAQFLVAVPMQQPTNEAMQQAPEQAASMDSGSQVLQQTVYYQFPGVVTLPVGAVPEGQASATTTNSQTHESQQQQVPMGLHQPSLAQPQMQVIGMVGAIPIVNQTPPLHFVKKKKGRFQFSQETPTVATGGTNTTGPAAVAVGGPTTVGVISCLTQPPMNAQIPSNISVPTPGQSLSSACSQLSATVQNPQTFDGRSAPTVKKLGRFVVTNVKDPGSIPRRIQTQQAQAQSPATPTENTVQQQAPLQQSQQQPINPNQISQPSQQTQAQAQNHIPSQQVMGQHERSLSSIPTYIDTQQFPMVLEPPTLASYSGPGVVQQQQFYQVQQPRGQQLPPLPPPQPPLDTLSQTQFAVATEQAKSTPPPTPGGSVSNNFVESPRKSQPIAVMPNGPVPKAPQFAEKSKAANGVPKKKPAQAQVRGGKPPQTIDSNGMLSSVGLGKVFYFLEQMKVEVTEADRTIKTLQTDMKLLRDKNKELEAKNRELEKKVKQEKTLREKTETMNNVLRRKVRDVKGDAPVVRPVDPPLEDSPEIGSRANLAEQSGAAGASKDPQSSIATATSRKKTVPTAPTVPTATSGDITTGNGGVSTAAPSTVGVISPTPAKPTITPKQPTRKGIPPRSDAVQKDDLTMKDSVPRNVRSNGLAPEGESMSLNRVPPASPVKMKPVATQPRRNDNAVPAQTRLPPARPVPTGLPGLPPAAPKLQCVSDFDPLKPTSSAPSNVPSDVIPVISIPTPVSLETGSINSACPSYQSTNEPTYSFVSENRFVVPITVGMDPAVDQGVSNGSQQSNVANSLHGLQQQSFMVLPQQQPFMFQQATGGVLQVPNMLTGQWTQSAPNSYPAPVYMNGFYSQQQAPEQQQQQQQAPQQQQHSSNTYDAFPPDPFDELLTHHQM